MKEKYILDTNFIYSLLDRKDPNHTKAFKKLSQVADSQFIIPVIVIVELMMSEASGVIDILQFINELFSDKAFIQLDLNYDILNTIDELSYSVKKKLKANDCIILASCILYKSKLLSFDKKLIKELDTLFP